MSAARALLESLLRDRKLDVTLTSSRGWEKPNDLASTGLPALDVSLGGGLLRGQLSEIVGPRSSGRTSVLCSLLAAATARGEVAALIDTCDRFDPASGAGAGVDLRRLLWVRESGDAVRALKAMNLVLQAGGFGVAAFDLADVGPAAIRRFPHTTWMRLARVIEGTQTMAVVVAPEHVARSPGGVTIRLDAADPHAGWQGTSDRARFLSALDVRPRIVSAFANASAFAKATADKPAGSSAG
jgi:hypothetical protein